MVGLGAEPRPRDIEARARPHGGERLVSAPWGDNCLIQGLCFKSTLSFCLFLSPLQMVGGGGRWRKFNKELWELGERWKIVSVTHC